MSHMTTEELAAQLAEPLPPRELMGRAGNGLEIEVEVEVEVEVELELDADVEVEIGD